MKARKFFAFVAAAGMLFAGEGCTPNEEGDGATADPLTYELNPTSMTALSGEETVETVQLTTNGDWNVVVPEEHSDIVVTPLNGKGNATVTVTVPAHESDRIVTLTFEFSKKTDYPVIGVTDEEQTLTFTISQNASGVEQVATNVKAVRDLLVAMNPTSTKTDVTPEVAAMTLTGVVVGMPDGNMGNNYLFAIQDDSTESGCGLTINHDNAAQMKKGDVVTFSLAGAKVSLYYGLLQLSASNSVELAVADKTVNVEPIEVAYADILSYESQYIKVAEKVTPASAAVGNAWNSGTSGTNVNFTTANNKTLVVRVNKDASFKSDIVPEKSGYLCGVASRYNSDIQLCPQYASDIQLTEEYIAPEPVAPVTTPYTSDAAFVCSADNTTNKCYALGKDSTINNEACSGVKFGTSSNAGFFTSTAVGVEGTKTLGFYGMAWKGKQATIYIKIEGSDDVKSMELKANNGATSNPPYTITVTDDDYYSVELTGLTATSKIVFSTDETFSTASSSAARAILAGITLK